MDDGTLVGEPATIETTMDQLNEELQQVGLHMAPHKMWSYCPSNDNLNIGQCQRDHREDGRTTGWGITTLGVPIGDDIYVKIVLQEKAVETVGYINKTYTMLQSHLQHYWILLQRSMQTQFDYWLQHCYPSQTVQPARRIDEAIAKVLGDAITPHMWEDEFAKRRLRLPVRLGGIGIRSRAGLAPRAFMGTFLRTIPLLIQSCVGENVPEAAQVPFSAAMIELFGDE